MTFILFFVGIVSLFLSFLIFLQKREIENIPTCTISDLKEGVTELQGTAREVQLLQSPLTKTECLLYEYEVERHCVKKSNRKHSRFASDKIASGNSFSTPFFLEDATGKILIFPQYVALVFPATFEFRWHVNQNELPFNLHEFIERERRQNDVSWYGNFHFKEHCIKDGEEIYVLGVAKRKEGLDANKRELVERINNELINKAGSTLAAEISDFVITKEDAKGRFIISNCSEKELIGRLHSQYVAFFCFGGILIAVTLLYLLFSRPCSGF